MGVGGDRELMRAHVAALFTSDASGRLLAVNETDGGVAPRFFLGRTARSTECWFRQDLDSDLVRALEAALLQERGNPGLDQPRDDGPTVFEQLLSASAPILKVWAGPALSFLEGCLDGREHRLRHRGKHGRPPSILRGLA